MGLPLKETGIVAAPSREQGAAPVEVLVLYTDIPSTLGALRTAAQLAQGLTARIRLLLIETVPYPLPLDEPRRHPRFLELQFQTLVDRYPADGASHPVETVAEIVLCRDAWEGLRARLPRGSAVVIGKRSHWWQRAADRLARRLRAEGHHVIRTAGVTSSSILHSGAKGLLHA